MQMDSVQQQIRAAPVDADLRFDRKYKLECTHYMFIVCPLHANYMSIGSTTATTTTSSDTTSSDTTIHSHNGGDNSK